jgi:hypothetical protein
MAEASRQACLEVDGRQKRLHDHQAGKGGKTLLLELDASESVLFDACPSCHPPVEFRALDAVQATVASYCGAVRRRNVVQGREKPPSRV